MKLPHPDYPTGLRDILTQLQELPWLKKAASPIGMLLLLFIFHPMTTFNQRRVQKPIPLTQLGKILRRHPGSEFHMVHLRRWLGQPLCPGLLSSLPTQVLTPRTFLLTNLHLRIYILENSTCNICVYIHNYGTSLATTEKLKFKPDSIQL